MTRGLVLSALVFMLVVQVSWSQIPQTMSYQGFLTDASSAPVADGNYSLAFGIYDVEAGGTALWTETHASVPVDEGIFSIILGSVTPLDIAFDAQYWLEVEVNGAVVSPRVPLTSSPYSLNAQTVAGDAVTTYHILNGTIIAEDVGFNYAGSTSPAGPATDLVSSGAVDTTDLADDAVTGDKIADGQVVRSINGKTDGVTIAGGDNVNVTDSDNTLTVSATGLWKLEGNAGTTPGPHFLGITNGTMLELNSNLLELKVGDARVMRLEYDFTCPNLIGGHRHNYVSSSVYGATIGGGGGSTGSGNENYVTENYGTIGGGCSNCIYADFATVGGGCDNSVGGDYASIGGGYMNYAGGGSGTVGGGYINHATGDSSTVPGGLYNTAEGHYSFAAGRKAKATHDGSFVWSGSNKSEEDYFESVAEKEFAVRCAGGARFVTQYSGIAPTKWAYLNPATAQWEVKTSSDLSLKDGFSPVDSLDVLTRLASMPVQTWRYRGEDTSIRHIGPTSQDFYAAFGMGRDDGSINALDAEGVALAAIQGLYELVKEKDAQIADQQQQIATMEERLKALEARMSVMQSSSTQREQ